MERKALYRGKRKLNGEWVYGSLIQIGNDWCHIVPEDCEYDDVKDRMIRVISSSVGQFTGGFDKHNTRIFEGDTCLKHGIEGVVKWFDDHQRFWIQHPGYNAGWHFIDKTCEVTGNIHDA